MRVAWVIVAASAAVACDQSQPSAVPVPDRVEPLTVNDLCGAPPTVRAKLPRSTEPELSPIVPNILVRIVSTAPLVGETIHVGDASVFGPRARFPVGALPPGAAFPRWVELAPGVEAPAAGDIVKLGIIEERVDSSTNACGGLREVTQIVEYARLPLASPAASRARVNLSGVIALLDEGTRSIHIFADGGYAAWTGPHVSYGSVPPTTVHQLLAAFGASSFDRLPEVATTVYAAMAYTEYKVLPGTLARTCGVARAVRVADDPEGLAPIVSALRAIYDADVAATELAIWAKPSGEVIPWPPDAPPLNEIPFAMKADYYAQRSALANRVMPPVLATRLKEGTGDSRASLIFDGGKYYRFGLAPCSPEEVRKGACVLDAYGRITLSNARPPRPWPRPLRLATTSGDRGAAVPASEPADFYTFWDEEYAEGDKLYRVHTGRRRR